MADKKPPRGEDFTVKYGSGVEDKLAADPALAEVARIAIAQIRQALDGVATGRFASLQEAMESIGAEPVNEDDDGR